MALQDTFDTVFNFKKLFTGGDKSVVGIDIGSSGTQVVFSKINLRRFGEDLSSRYYVVSRATLYQSPVVLTPYRSEEMIDDTALGVIIDNAYADAGLHPDDIDTGVVILTGEALRRENAAAIGAILAEQGGEFVCAAAGHHMEAMLAAYGSGAARASHDTGQRILNWHAHALGALFAQITGGAQIQLIGIRVFQQQKALFGVRDIHCRLDDPYQQFFQIEQRADRLAD